MILFHVLLLVPLFALRAAETAAVFPVRVSANGHYLVDARGKPFLLHGDTAWSLILQLTKDEAEEYLENRRQKGVNSLIVNLIDFKYADHAPLNRAGDAPFAKPGDFASPNEAYFAHADWVIRRAGEKGMLVVLNPCYTGNGPPGSSKRDGFANEIVASTPEVCRGYGRFLGQRYKGFSNIIWQAGGDQTPKAGSLLERNWLEILLGIKDRAPSHHWTAHWNRPSTARDQPAFAPHMTIDSFYPAGRTYMQALRAYNRPDPRPAFLNESHYEGFGLTAYSNREDESPKMMRAQAYWALLSGATGHHFGSHHVWPFGWTGMHQRYHATTWRQGLESQGSREMVFVKRLFEARAWFDLVPDQDHSVVTSGYGTFGTPGRDDLKTGGDYVTAARTSDGKLVMAYVPSTSARTRTITVNMARLSGPANARWYNPTSGTFTEINGSPMTNSGSREFTTPGDNGTGANDWVLVLETASARNFTSDRDAAVKFGVHEITLTGDGSVANPFDTIATVTFTPPSDAAKAKTVQAFFDGGNTWRARTYVSEPGAWTWSSQCATDKGLHGHSGTFTATASKLRGRLLIHPKNPRQWMTENGRWFLNLNDTSYFLLCSHDGDGNPVPDAEVRAYVADAVSRGITSFRSFIANGPKPFMGERRADRHRWNDLFADEGFTRPDLNHLRVADRRLRWLLDAHPDAYMQFILFPLGKPWRSDEVFWTKLSPPQKERIMRYLIARFAAYPQLFWLIVNDAHFGPEVIKPRPGDTQTAPRTINFPNSCAMVREVGAFFQQHDPWQHPLSAGPARTAAFHFENESWATYIHLEDNYAVEAKRCAQYHVIGKPVFLGEDRYEHDHPATHDPCDMRYFQRRLFWAWLLSDGSANYGGRWWVLHPYGQTGQRPARSVHHPEHTYTAPLTGLDSVKHIRDYFAQRRIELSDFEPDDALVKDLGGAVNAGAPKLARRGREEFLIYHPNADPALDDQHTRPHNTQAAALSVDLRNTVGSFAVEWHRAADGVVQVGEPVSGGDWRQLVSPWKGHDCVARLLKHNPSAAPPRQESARADDRYTERKTYIYKTVGDLPIKADVYRQSGDDVRPVIVWIHGGGLITGGRGGPSLEQRRRYLDAGYVIVSIDYRLAPETKLPAIIEDVRDAITWVRAQGPELFKIDPKRLAVIGHSAGGYLTLMAGFAVEPRPQALIAFYGYGDVDGEWYAKPHEIYRKTRPLFTKEEAHQAIGTKETTNGGVKGRGNFYTYCRQNGVWPQEVVGYDPRKQPRQFDRFCPIRNVTKDYPPTLLLHGDNDIDVPHQQSVAMAAELKRRGVVHEFISILGGGHGFDSKGMQDATVSAAFDQVGRFLKKHVEKW